MRKLITSITPVLSIMVLLIIAIFLTIVYATPGDPIKFLNTSQNVTAEVGGNTGIGNFTGSVYGTKIYQNGDQVIDLNDNSTIFEICNNDSFLPYQNAAANVNTGNYNITASWIIANINSNNITNTPAKCSVTNTFMTEFNGSSSTCTAVDQDSLNFLSNNTGGRVIGNITQPTEYYHCFDESCNSSIHYNGTSLIIKVN